MRSHIRPLSGLVVALAGLGAVGCGGNSGTQPTSASPNITLATATAYSASAAPVGTVDDSDSRAAVSIIPLASLTSASGQTVVLWGTRGSDGTVTSVRESAYKDGNVTLYARYNAEGGILSVLGAGSDSDAQLQAQAGSYLTFSDLEASGNTIIGTGGEVKNGAKGDTGKARATLTSNGVVVAVLKDDGTSENVSTNWAAAKATARDEATDPLAGLTTVYQDSPTRAKILSAVVKAAGLVVKKPFNAYVSQISGSLFIDQLAKSYTTYTAKGLSTGAAGSDETPLPYRSDLP